MSIAEALQRKNEQLPQFDHLWRVELPDLKNGIIDSSSTGIPAKAITVAQQLKGMVGSDNLSHRVYAVDVPHTKFDTSRTTFGSRYLYTATNNDIGPLNLVVDEYEDGATLDYAVKWQSLIRNPDGTYNPPAHYKRDIKIIRMSNSGYDLHVYIYRDCFLTDIGTTSLNYDSSNVSQFNLTFVGDRIDYVLLPAEEVIALVNAVQGEILAGTESGLNGLSSRNGLLNLIPAALGPLVRGSGKLALGPIAANLAKPVLGNVVNKVKDFFF